MANTRGRFPAPPSPSTLDDLDEYPSPPHSPNPPPELSPQNSYSGRAPPSSANMRRRSTQGSSASRRRGSASVVGEDGRTGKVGLQPPKSEELWETEEDWRTQHEIEKTESSHHLPLVIVALPPLGAIIHGRAENWADAILVLLICFYLYQLIKVPWDIYYASHGRIMLPSSTSQASDPSDPAYSLSPQEHASRLHSIQVLKRTELASLSATVLSPAIGCAMLWFVRPLLSDPDRFITKTLIALFGIATSVKPWMHLCRLIKHTSLYHQEKVWYPSTDVHNMRRRMEALEAELGSLTRAFATKDDIRILRDGVDVPLTQLGKAVRRFDRKEEYLRLSSEERFALLDARLEQARLDSLRNAELIDHLRREHESASVLRLASHLVHHLLGLPSSAGGGGKGKKQKRLRWYQKGALWYVFLPVNAGTKAIEWVGGAGEYEEGTTSKGALEGAEGGGGESSEETVTVQDGGKAQREAKKTLRRVEH